MEVLKQDLTKDLTAISAISAIPAILDVICRTTGMGFATVARVTDDRWMACAVLDNISFGLQAGGELKVETTLCNEVNQYKKPIVVDNFAEDAVYANHHTPAMYGLKSYISIPIFLKDGRFFGTLCAIDPNPAKVNNPETIGMFELYAELIAMHLHNFELLETTQATLVEEKKLALLRDQFIAILGHDMRNPVGAVRNIGQILKNGNLNSDKQKEFGVIIQNSTYRMMGLIENVMDFARGRLGKGIELERKAQDIQPTLQHVIDELQLIWPQKTIKHNIALYSKVNVDDKRIAQLLSNLLGNALFHGISEQPVFIEATSDDIQFILKVTNGGKPIPKGDMKNIFHPFSRGNSQTGKHGLGLGLYISSEIVKAHGGNIDVSSNDIETVFTVKILNAQIG